MKRAKCFPGHAVGGAIGKLDELGRAFESLHFFDSFDKRFGGIGNEHRAALAIAAYDIADRRRNHRHDISAS